MYTTGINKLSHPYSRHFIILRLVEAGCQCLSVSEQTLFAVTIESFVKKVGDQSSHMTTRTTIIADTNDELVELGVSEKSAGEDLQVGRIEASDDRTADTSTHARTLNESQESRCRG